ncbi:hypothetical protein CEB3_c30180 [Peptococcaceae bacterium CEB3]|nr:hypothetical protein CEB3_c30180 [Peptococcaceae bacterium CEB3]
MSVQSTEKPVKLGKNKKRKSINTFVLLFCVMVAMAILTYILPAGHYARHVVKGLNVVIPNTYKTVARTPVGFLGLFSSIPQGMEEAAPIAFYVIIIGGMINVMNATGALNALLTVTARRFSKQGLWFIALLMLLFSLGGSLLGMAEESLMYLPVVIPFALAMGYDLFTGVAIVLLGMAIGFTTAIMNAFTIGIAQSVAQLPLFSGIWLRLILYVIVYIAAVAFVYRHAKKVKENPSLGIWGDRRYESVAQLEGEDVKLEVRHKWVLLCFVLAIATLVVGVIKFNFSFEQYGGVFILLSIVIAFIGQMSTEDYLKNFMQGSANILPAALIIGLSRGAVVVLTNGNILDTILYHAATALETVPSSLSAAGMFLFQATLHILVPSGSGQAMLTMPIMVPLADLLHVTRQTACLIFTLADGIGNTILPTSGYFMAALSLSGLAYGAWAKKTWHFIVGQYVVAIIVVVLANMVHYGPF